MGWRNAYADHAAQLLKRTALSEGIHAQADKPVPHGDNGATLKATTVLGMLSAAENLSDFFTPLLDKARRTADA